MEKQELQNLVITGASEGIGYETMKTLYLTGKYNIVFASRNSQRNQQAKQKILKLSQLIKFSQIVCFTNQKYFKKIHVLINNAGALFNQKEIVNQLNFPVQKTLLVDYFSVCYLILLFFQQKIIDLHTKQQIRIINVSSSAHAYCQNGMLQDLDCQKKFYSTYRQYAIAKFSITTFTKQLAKKLQKYYGHSDKMMIKVVSLHPGVINTNIGNDVLLARVIKFVTKFFMQTVEQGAQSSIKLSLMDFKSLENGGYYNQVGKLIKADKRTENPQIGNKLWQLNEKAFGFKFQI